MKNSKQVIYRVVTISSGWPTLALSNRSKQAFTGSFKFNGKGRSTTPVIHSENQLFACSDFPFFVHISSAYQTTIPPSEPHLYPSLTP